MALKLITAPASEPVTLTEAKAHLRVDDTSSDTLITSLITAAREYCEGWQNRAYITQIWELWLDGWPVGKQIILPRPPLQSVTSIKYYDKDGTEYTLDTDSYIVDATSGRVVLKADYSWPETTLRSINGVCVRYTAGYGTATSVPAVVKQAMLLLIGHWYENREAVITGTTSRAVEFAVDALLWQDRVVPV